MKVKVEHRPRQRRMGRFGGGWQLVLGIKASRRTLIAELLVFSIRIDREDHRR